MKIKVLASGSKGNSTLIITEKTKLLIDAGISEVQIFNSLKEIGINIKELDGILITHTHSDHIKGLLQLVKKHQIKVFATVDLLYELIKIIPIESISVVEKECFINDLKIIFIPTSHDVISYGFVLENERNSLVYITDTGYINRKYYDLTKNKSIYIIESNHDEELLMNGPYPYYLKQRVISDKGHLSNRYTGKYLKKVIGNDTKYIFLAHISENNNSYDLALSQVLEEMKDSNFNFDNIIVTHQNEETEIIEV